MAAPHFNSQHSEVMLDVSAFHSSAQSTPQTKHHQAAKVANSPTIEASQNHRIAESVERVEDSYQESLPMQPPPQHADNDEEDDLYSLSPKGRQSLDATVAKRKAQAQRKQASIPKAKTIDALLDAGATVPSSAVNVATSDTKQTEKPQTSTHTRHRMDVNAKTGFFDVDLKTATDQHAKDKDRKPDATNPETSRPRRDNSRKGDSEVIANAPKDKTESRKLPAHARNATTKGPVEEDRPPGTADAIKTKTHEAHLSNGEKTSKKNHGSRGVDTGNTGLPALSTRTIPPAQSQDSRQAKASTNQSKGRPQRQAKQTALGKLKAKHSRTESDVDGTTDDSQDDGFDVAAHSKQSKKVTDRKQKAKHLPTPVTEGNLPEKQVETKASGKLKPAKQKQTNAAASAKAQPNKTSTRGTAVSPQRTSRSGHSVAQENVAAHPSKELRLTQSPPGHRRAGTVTTNRKEQHQPEDTPPPRRPGALKRPGRPNSRDRRPQTDTPYDFPEPSSNTRKKRRSISRASKVLTAKAGPARQRMQSESVKERLDGADDGLQLPSVSRPTSPRTGGPKGRSRKASASRRKNEVSRPPPTTQARVNTTQLESHISQSVRSSYAANLESNEPATGSKQTGTREKPGSSQAHAIMIEQDSRSEASCSPSPRKPANSLSTAMGQAMSRQTRIERAETPAMMPSSPPGTDRESIYKLAKEKPTIIAFSRQGPRNQGVTSAKKVPGSVAPSNVFTESRTTKAGTPGDHAKTIGLATQLFPPSSQPSYKRPTQVTHTAQPSNVAKGEESIFEEFTRNGQNTALAHMLRKPPTKASELAQEDQDGRFAVIDDFEGTTLMYDYEQAEDYLKQPTASQVAMPPPNVATRGKKNSKAANAPVQLLTKTAAKAAATKDTPRPEPDRKVDHAQKAQGALIPAPDEQTSTLSVTDGPERKIARAMPPDNVAKSSRSNEQTTTQHSQQKRKRGLAEPQPGSPSKRIRISQEAMLEAPEARLPHARKAPGSLSVQAEDSTDRLDRRKSRPSRRSTQTSQGVDILGSPYPKGLEVPKQTTALEVFSQQTGLSSDQIERSDDAQSSRLDLQAISRMVPTTQVGLPVLAAPRGRSKAVTRIASGTLAEQLLVVRSVQPSEENPFTSSRERESSAGEQPASNKFREALRQRGIDLSERPPAVRSEELGDGSFDDAERTLVEPVDDFEKANQDIEKSLGVSEASHASSPDGAAKVLEDVGDWRNSLKPHQSHLFDSLVIAAHKLVRHMVDDEAADRTMVADYRRRGEIIVDELQRAHAKEYQQYTQNVQGWKVQAADELAAHGRKLKQRMRDAEKARAERKKGLLVRNRFDDVLEELVAGLD